MKDYHIILFITACIVIGLFAANQINQLLNWNVVYERNLSLPNATIINFTMVKT